MKNAHAENTTSTNAPDFLTIPLDRLVPSDTNPPTRMDKQQLAELKNSIHANGLLQPILVRAKERAFEIISGHRRFAAFKELAAEHPKDTRYRGLPATIREVNDVEVPVLQLAENINRKDLDPLETADQIAQSIANGFDPDNLAKRFGWTRRNLNRHLQLRDAPPWLRALAYEVKVRKKKRDEHGKLVLDPATNEPVFDSVTCEGLGFTPLSELLTLYNHLHDLDEKQLQEQGGSYAPIAERKTYQLAQLAAEQGWSTSRLRDEIKRIREPQQKSSSAPRAVPMTVDKCVIEPRRIVDLSADAKRDLAAVIAEALKKSGFKAVTIDL